MADLSTQSSLLKQVGAFRSEIIPSGISYDPVGAYALVALEDTIFNYISGSIGNISEYSSGSAPIGAYRILPAGITLFGEFDRIDVNSGAVILYEA